MALEKSAGAVIVNLYRPQGRRKFALHAKSRREYLLLYYETGHWDFPKGHLEGREEPENAARREIREETGLTVHRFVPGFTHHMRYWFWSYPRHRGDKPRESFKIVTFFLAYASSRHVRLSWEHTGYAWLPYRDAVKLATYNSAKELLRKAETFLRKEQNFKPPNPRRFRN